jgi:hypothetical protein
MPLERQVITDAIRTAPNLTIAAQHLGASRRTLQNRMRAYGMPRGKSGRPIEPLPYKSLPSTGTLLTVGALAVAGVLAWKWWQTKPTVTAMVGEDELSGLD